MENSLRLSHCIKWPSRGWNGLSCVYFAVLHVCVRLYTAGLVVPFFLFHFDWRYIPYVMSVRFQQVATIRRMCTQAQQKQTRSRSALHIHQKNAKLSILNHHKLLCFKYYFVSLKVSSFVLFFSFSLLFFRTKAIFLFNLSGCSFGKWKRSIQWQSH